MLQSILIISEFEPILSFSEWGIAQLKGDLEYTYVTIVKVSLLDFSKYLHLIELKQGIRWKRGMLPKCLLSTEGRTCKQTPLVHQGMTKKTTFYENN